MFCLNYNINLRLKVSVTIMDFDENDILLTNTFMNTSISDNITPTMNEEFRKYYTTEIKQAKEKKIRESLDRISLQSITLNEDTDGNSLMNTNRFSLDTNTNSGQININRKTKEVKTFINVDSRDRSKLLFGKPNNFKIFLGRTFTNIKSIRLVSIEFPNTNAVINSVNNKIYWRNLQDIEEDIIDNITGTYPVYDVTLRIGSYISTTLQSEMISKLGLIKRKSNSQIDFHYFDVNLDISTDIVTFTSLLLSQAPNNPFSVSVGTGIIQVTQPSHGYITGEKVYIIGAKTVAGINSTVLNTSHTVTRLNSSQFQFEVNVKASETVIGGGNVVKTGKEAPFQLLFGENSNTIAQNIGFPLENSSTRIETDIKTLNNIYLIQLDFTRSHGMENTYTYIGQIGLLDLSLVTPNIDGNRSIARIVSKTSILIIASSPIDFPSFNTGTFTFNSQVFDITRISNYRFQTVLMTSFTTHNLQLNDIGRMVTFYNTTSTPSFDGPQEVHAILSPTEVIFSGHLFDGGDINVLNPGDGGVSPRHTPLTTLVYNITNVVPGVMTRLTIPSHALQIGDQIKIVGLGTTPSITTNNSGLYEVYSIPDSDNIMVNFSTVNVDTESISTSQVQTKIVSVSFPYHLFNKIINIQNSSVTGKVRITTLLPHNLTDGEKIRIMETNCFPIIDGGGYIVTVISSHILDINYPPGLTSVGTNGIIGMNQNFFLYGVESLGGISSNRINGVLYNVRNIIDEHTFNFTCSEFATFNEIGGGSNVFISSLFHGFSGIQDNTKNSLLNRSINLEGENYVFLCSPQLSTMLNTGSVRNIFARITLDQSPGSMVFNFLSSAKDYDTTPLDSLNELEFSMFNYDGTLYEFNDLDYSFVLEITEVIDITELTNVSSKRGL